MPLKPWFRLSCYLTLALSCSALVFAETPFLPDLQICLLPVLALLLLGWWVEGRWRLPNWGANLLGAVIAAGGASWLATQLADNDSLLVRIPLHLALLPYMGPLLLAALLVKVFGSREAGDFWRLQGLGLTQIGLGCVLDGGPVFGSLMTAYLAVALVCLALRYRLAADRREGAPASAFATGWWSAFTLRWTLGIMLPALLLFLLTPRRDNGAWEPLNGLRSDSLHFSGGEEMNLNDTGRIELDDAIAFQVVAVDSAGRPKVDLPGDQRWRGSVLDQYDNGKWRTAHRLPRMSRLHGQQKLPNFGADQFFLIFTVPPRQPGALVLAEPIRFGPPSARLPVEMLSDEDHSPLFHERAGSILPLPVNSRREHRYRQVVPGGGEGTRPPEGVSIGHYSANLADPSVRLRPQLQAWTVDLLRRLAESPRYRLPEGVRAELDQPPQSFVIDPDHSEAVARALAEYLAGSGDFTYSLDMARKDLTLDPILDFLINVKQGHCERYATALALMLRSVGIPARLVKGFRGCEHLGDGHYIVRHRHAHAWVEILLPHHATVGTANVPAGGHLYDWLELDPTPPESTESVWHLSLAHLWEEIQRLGRTGWQSLIIGYNAEEQAELWDRLWPLRRPAILLRLGLAVIAMGVVLWMGLFLRRLRRRRRTNGVRPAGTTAFYQRLLHVLGSYTSLRPSVGQTPREYGAAAQTVLRGRPHLAVLAELPVRIVELFYRVRFGAQPLSEEERHALDAELARFAETLRTEPRT